MKSGTAEGLGSCIVDGDGEAPKGKPEGDVKAGDETESELLLGLEAAPLKSSCGGEVLYAGATGPLSAMLKMSFNSASSNQRLAFHVCNNFTA